MKQISVRFPEEFLEEIDTIAKIEYTDRTALMKKALRKYIAMELEKGGLREVVVRRYLEGKINYRNLEVLLGKGDAQAVKASKRVMDKGEELAKKLA